MTIVTLTGPLVVFSGATVDSSLLALVVLPVLFPRGVGYGALLIPLAPVVVACTLLPTRLLWSSSPSTRNSRTWRVAVRRVCPLNRRPDRGVRLSLSYDHGKAYAERLGA